MHQWRDLTYQRIERSDLAHYQGLTGDIMSAAILCGLDRIAQVIDTGLHRQPEILVHELMSMDVIKDITNSISEVADALKE